ncbi:MAG: hypothetical protein J0M05_08140 [Candidatus Kapabacteria bacterium]|nr:hypothetical protein [Candidatus Kapabacteria bacterium]
MQRPEVQAQHPEVQVKHPEVRFLHIEAENPPPEGKKRGKEQNKRTKDENEQAKEAEKRGKEAAQTLMAKEQQYTDIQMRRIEGKKSSGGIDNYSIDFADKLANFCFFLNKIL